MAMQAVTIIFSPYHVGIRGDAVGSGPDYLRDRGLVSALKDLGITVHEAEVEGPGDAEGDIGRSFAIFRNTAKLVAAAHDASSFPVVVAGNCGATVGVFAGLARAKSLKGKDVGCVWFDAHDDFNVPDTVLSGYFDSMPIATMAGQCWKALTGTLPGFKPLDLRKLVHCGLRDLNDMERARVAEAGHPVVWGGADRKTDFQAELGEILDRGQLAPAMVHVDLDVLDPSVGQVNRFEPAPGGLSEDDLVGCLRMLAARAEAVSLTVASIDPGYDNSGKIGDVAIRAVVAFVEALRDAGALMSGN